MLEMLTLLRTRVVHDHTLTHVKPNSATALIHIEYLMLGTTPMLHPYLSIPKQDYVRNTKAGLC